MLACVLTLSPLVMSTSIIFGGKRVQLSQIFLTRLCLLFSVNSMNQHRYYIMQYETGPAKLITMNLAYSISPVNHIN